MTTVTDRHYTIHNRGKSYNTRLFQSDCDENYRRSSLVLADENGGDSYLRLFVIVAASDILNLNWSDACMAAPAEFAYHGRSEAEDGAVCQQIWSAGRYLDRPERPHSADTLPPRFYMLVNASRHLYFIERRRRFQHERPTVSAAIGTVMIVTLKRMRGGKVSAGAAPPTPTSHHRTLGMMVNGTIGLLASSSSAVRKHSVAASSFPCACSTSPRLFHTS